MALTPSPELLRLAIDHARRGGKSIMTEILKTELDTHILGHTPDFVIFDELATYPTFPFSLVKTFSDTAWQAATVEIHRSSIDKRDPRNPNPVAGPIPCWIVKVGERELPTRYTNQRLAEIAGENLHKRLVKGLVEDMQTHSPQFGRF